LTIFLQSHLRKFEETSRGYYIPKVIGNGLACKTVLVFPPGKTSQASPCSLKLFGLLSVYFACAVFSAALNGSYGEAVEREVSVPDREGAKVGWDILNDCEGGEEL
jgi:hypothetical protein